MAVSEQKIIEQLNYEITRQKGETDYYKHLAGTYRNSNHEHIQQIKKLKKLITSLITIFIGLYAVTVILLLLWR